MCKLIFCVLKGRDCEGGLALIFEIKDCLRMNKFFVRSRFLEKVFEKVMAVQEELNI